MKTENIIIEALPIRFLDLFAEDIPTYTEEDMKRILKGYIILGFGAITVALYHPELRRKYDSKIILISQDYLKVFFAYIHARYPKCENFPAISLLAKTTYFPKGVEKPIGQDSDKTSLVYCVPEYWSVIYDTHKKEWYRIRSEKLADLSGYGEGFWDKLKGSDLHKIDKNSSLGKEERVIDQLNFLYRLFDEIVRMSPKKTIETLEKMKTNQNTEPIKKALLDISKSAITLDKSMFWDVTMEELPRRPDHIEDQWNYIKRNRKLPRNMWYYFRVFRNIGIDRLVENAILLDVLF